MAAWLEWLITVQICINDFLFGTVKLCPLSNKIREIYFTNDI